MEGDKRKCMREKVSFELGPRGRLEGHMMILCKVILFKVIL